MDTINDHDRSLEGERPLALHIRDRRQWYGDRGLTQQELAKLAGITQSLLGSYESRHDLPEALRSLLALALALELPLQSLIDPRHFEELRDEIDERRRLLGFGPAHLPMGFRCREHDA